MSEQELLAAIGRMMDEKLEPLHERLDSVNARLDGVRARLGQLQADVEQIKEDTEITRGAANTLIEWAEKTSMRVEVPLFEKTR